MTGEPKRVAVLTNRLLDWETRQPRYGGGEHYCLALGELLREQGFEVRFFQAGHESFEGEYHGFPVTALPIGRVFSEFHPGVCDRFYEETVSYDHVIINVPAYASGRVREDAILVCHGIWFDHDNWPPPIRFRTEEWFVHLYRAFAQPARVVSVDTNSINVIRSFWPELAGRMQYIPNWVDLDRFTPPARREGTPTVLFPRRIEVNRGSRLLAPILERVPHSVSFRWAGDGEPNEVEAVRRSTAGDARMDFVSASFDEMPRIYQEASIAVIPTIACEGTSLACLEAMASGCAVVATTVGGLPELVRHEVDGLLVNPDADSIAEAIRRLLDDEELRTRLADAAVESSRQFSRTAWRSRWIALLETAWSRPVGDGANELSEAGNTFGSSLLLAPALGGSGNAASVRVAHLEAQLEHAAVISSAAAARDEFMKIEVENRDRSLGFLQTEVAARDRVIDSLRHQIEPLERDAAEREPLLARLGEAETTVAAMRKQVDSLEAEIASRETLIARLRVEAVRADELLAATRAEMESHKLELASSLESRDAEIAILGSQIEIKDKENETLRATSAQQAEGIEWLRGEVALRDEELRNIHESKFWGVASFYWRGVEKASTVKSVLRMSPKEAALRTARRVLPRGVKHYLKRFWDPNQQISPKEAVALAALQSKSVNGSPPAPEKSLPEAYDVICFSIIDWSFRWQRPQQIMARFAARGHRVFFISTTDFLPEGERRYSLKPLRENVWELRLAVPRPLDVYGGEIPAEVLEAIQLDLDALRRELQITAAVSVVQVPTWAPAALAAREKFGWKAVYDCMDDWDTFPGMKPALIDQERRLVSEADVVVVSAQRLLEKWDGRNEHLILARNAADFEHYASAAENDLLSDCPRPVVGYFGAIADWFDLPLMVRLAKERPQYTFVLIGGIFNVPMAELERLPNVRILGQKPYELMPSYLMHFDACIIPFVVNEVTEATDPVKFYEYISLGKPVVAPKMSELFTYSDYLYIADDADDFLRKVDAAVEESDPRLREARVELARANTWDERIERIESEVRAAHEKLSVIVVTYFNLDYTRLCVESVLRNTIHPNYELILVDNGSTDGTPDYLHDVEREHDHVKVILNERNLGFARANNQGLAIASGDYLVLLNNDTVVPNGWGTRMIRNMKRTDVGLVVAVTNFSGNESKIEVPYTDLDAMEEFAARYTLEHEDAIFDIRVAAMYCVGVRRDVFEKVGTLDERFSVGMFEDDDYSHRIRLAGYRVVCAEGAFVHHFGQASFKKLSPTEYQAIWDRNQRLYEEKWGVAWTPHTLRKEA